MSKLIADRPVVGKLEGRADGIYNVVIDVIKEEKDLRAFAIYGDWGSGKTSICYNIYEHFRLLISESTPINDSYIVPVWFDAWRFQHEKTLYPALLRTIGSTLLQRIKNDTAEKLGKSLIKISSVIKSFLYSVKVGIPLTGIEVSPKDGFEQFDKESNKEDLFSQITSLGQSPYFEAFEILQHISHDIRINNKKILILLFVDDLDRCLPDVAFEIIEQMKIWFDMDGYTFCLALNKSEMEQVVTQYLKTHLDIQNDPKDSEAKRMAQDDPKDSEAKRMAQDYLLKILPLGIYIKKYKDVLEKDKDKEEIVKLIDDSKEISQILRVLKNHDPDEIFSCLKEKNEQKEGEYSFRKLINVANEIYVENLIHNMEEK